ncbi:putative ABC-type nitrate transporter [Helianthus annuus]|nr:putative ABC-type nitrate transporter [Helianthus annuus]
MGIAVNLVTYLGGTMHLPSSTSANVVTDFLGTSFLLCLLGGFLADTFLGRFKTIVIFASIQALVSLLIIHTSNTFLHCIRTFTENHQCITITLVHVNILSIILNTSKPSYHTLD